MSDFHGNEKPSLQSLVQIKDRISFLYLEQCKISRENSAIIAQDGCGTIHIPSAIVSVLLLGPGTSITHRAVELIGDSGMSIVWVGEKGVRYYASGRSMNHSSSLLLQQAKLVSNNRSHLAVARRMYEMRFPDEDVSKLSMQQLRGREGSRVRDVYRRAAKNWNVKWNGRVYDPHNFSSSDPINQALSAGNACLYGLAHAVIVALGCSPGLGFVHVGHELSFVYDIGDLYKAEVVIPIAFEIASSNPCNNLASLVRRRVRDELFSKHVLERMVQDIRRLLLDEAVLAEEGNVNAVYLWDNISGHYPSGISYGSGVL